MGLIKTVIILSIGVAIGYYFGIGHSWADFVRTIGL